MLLTLILSCHAKLFLSKPWTLERSRCIGPLIPNHILLLSTYPKFATLCVTNDHLLRKIVFVYARRAYRSSRCTAPATSKHGNRYYLAYYITRTYIFLCTDSDVLCCLPAMIALCEWVINFIWNTELVKVQFCISE